MRAGGQSSPSPSHLLTDSVQSTHHSWNSELARGRKWNRNLEPNFCPDRDLSTGPLDWQYSMLTTRLPCTQLSWTKHKSVMSSCAYHASASRVWNPLCLCSLNSLPSFRKQLKTRYFCLSGFCNLSASSTGGWLQLDITLDAFHNETRTMMFRSEN